MLRTQKPMIWTQENITRNTNQRQTSTHAISMLTATSSALQFTPVMSTIGGVLIGLAAVMKMALNGRILGISGIYGGLFRKAYEGWRFAFLFGLAVGGAWLKRFLPTAFGVVPGSFPLWQSALGGLLVGVGTAMGNGCTSGHGVCGLARRSVRSLANVATFMVVAMVTAQVAGTAGKLGVPSSPLGYQPAPWSQVTLGLQVGAMALVALVGGWVLGRRAEGENKERVELGSEVLTGMVFAIGLGLAGMLQPQKVVGFLNTFRPMWDPSLACVMGAALAVTTPAFYYLQKNLSTCALGSKLGFPNNNTIDQRLLLGGGLFGVGWGLCGYCPGPALVSAITGSGPVLLTNVCLAIGLAGYHNWLKKYFE